MQNLLLQTLEEGLDVLVSL